jgi:hypothetical protein
VLLDPRLRGRTRRRAGGRLQPSDRDRLRQIGSADDLTEASEYLAAEVIRDFCADGLLELPRPLLWIEYWPGRRRRGSGRYFLLRFAAYRPRPEGLGFVKRVSLGSPEREPLTSGEVHALTGEGSLLDP